MQTKLFDQENIEFFQTLLKTNSPSGYEQEAIKCYTSFIKPFCASVSTDILGNTTGIINPDGKIKIMLAAHCDEIGLQVVHISDEGYIYFRKIGGIDKHTLPGSRVNIITSSGNISGVIGKKPPHIQTPQEKEKAIELDDLWIDIGAETAEDVKKTICVGDPITFDIIPKQLGANKITSKAIDDKAGAFIVSQVLKELSLCTLDAAVYGVATTQEELGLRGAGVASNTIKPDIAFIIDTSISSDVPNVSRTRIGDFDLGKGPGVNHSADNNIHLVKQIQKVARKNKVPIQNIASIVASGGTDASRIQISNSGVATAIISIPNRYLHSQVEICDLRDLYNSIQLIKHVILSITTDTITLFNPNHMCCKT